MTSVLMTLAAINEILGYILFTRDHPGTSFQPYLPITLIGAVPFLLTASLIILAVWDLARRVGPVLSRSSFGSAS